MPVRRVLLALALLSAVQAVRAAEFTFLKGEPLKGDLVKIDDKEFTAAEGDKRITRPILDLLKIDFKEVGKPAAGTEFADVELVDGTVLHCAKWSIKKRDVELTLLAGPAVKLKLDSVATILSKAHVEANAKDWKSRVAAKRGKDVLVLAREGIPQSLEGTLGDADPEGESIEFVLAGDSVTRKPKQATLHGLIFKNLLDPKAPAAQCKLLDTVGDVVMVSSVASTEKGLAVTTPAGVKIEFGYDSLGRLDYTKGKLDYLSDLEPTATVTSSDAEEGDRAEQQHVYKDTSLAGPKAALKLGGNTYPKGLALRPFTELVYDLKGEYQEFSAVVGLDDNVGGFGPTVLIVEGNGRELEKLTFAPTDKKKFQALKLNIKDVQKLRIIVKSGDDFDIGKHLDLADAKVSK